jgi:hypothetical protein
VDPTKQYVRVGVTHPRDFPMFGPGKALWRLDEEYKALTRHHVAQMCYAADQAFLECTGEWGKSRQSWQAISHDRARTRAWREGPPKDSGAREALWNAIHDAMVKFSQADVSR